MKKGIFIALPVLLLAAAAYTLPGVEHKAPPPMMHGWAFGGFRLGVIVSEINPHLKNALQIESGVLVDRVLPDSPAEKAGIKEGDILLKVDGRTVSDQEEVRSLVQSMHEAKEMAVDLLRDGKKLTVTVAPEKREMDIMMAGFGRNYIGVELQQLDTDLASYFKVDPNVGVLVVRVESESPAAKAGLHSGDVVTSFNGKKVNSADDVIGALDDMKEGETAEISVLRHGSEMKLTVKPESRRMPRMDVPRIPPMPDMPGLPDQEELRKELDGVKLELEEVRREKLDVLKEEIEKDIHKQMEELRQELDAIKKSQ